MGNWKGAFGCALIAFILVLVTLFGAWFSMSMEGESGGYTVKGSVDMGLRDMTMTAEAMGMEITNTTSYSDMGDSEFIDVFNLTQIFVILAIIFTLLFFIFALMVGMGKVGSKIGMILGVLAIVFILISFLYFMVALPSTMEEDDPLDAGISGFWGSDEISIGGDSMSVSWGPGWAWYLMIVSLILALIGTVFLKGAEPAEPAYAPEPYAEVPPPPMEEQVAPPVEEMPAEMPPEPPE